MGLIGTVPLQLYYSTYYASAIIISHLFEACHYVRPIPAEAHLQVYWSEGGGRNVLFALVFNLRSSARKAIFNRRMTPPALVARAWRSRGRAWPTSAAHAGRAANDDAAESLGGRPLPRRG
jgi:hypothetical protein